MKAIETRTAILSVDEKGINIVKTKKLDQTLEDAVENVQASKSLGAGKKIPMLCDIRDIISQTRDCQLYYTGKEAQEVYLAVALIIGSPISKILGNFFIGLRSQNNNVPLKMFNDEKIAYQWLESFLEASSEST